MIWSGSKVVARIDLGDQPLIGGGVVLALYLRYRTLPQTRLANDKAMIKPSVHLTPTTANRPTVSAAKFQSYANPQ